jgi:hypothetical protein
MRLQTLRAAAELAPLTLVLLAWILLAGALLLLAGLRLPATLLAGLLTRVLVLLARIRILTAHSEFSFFASYAAGDNQPAWHWLQGNSGSAGQIAWR